MPNKYTLTESGSGEMQGSNGLNSFLISSTDLSELPLVDSLLYFLDNCLLFLGVSVCFLALVNCRDV